MSLDALREAARLALEGLGPVPATGEIARASIDVVVDGVTEMVAVRLGQAGLSSTCTCGVSGCVHARLALSLLAGDEAPPAQAESSPDVRVLLPKARSGGEDAAALSAALRDVVTAVARVGVHSGQAAAVRDSLSPLFEAAPKPLPLGIARWVGRLKNALTDNDVGGLARLLHGATLLAKDLEDPAPDESALGRLVALLGVRETDAERIDRISDRQAVEVAREIVDGLQLGTVERRYLVDLGSGDCYREERLREEGQLSLGPFPRLVHVGLAELDPGSSPRRVQLLQYAASPEVPQAAWTQVGGWAVHDWEVLLDTYRAVISSAPGLAEPAALVTPAALEADVDSIRILDRQGLALHLDGGPLPATLEVLSGLSASRTPAWLFGRLVDREGLLRLRPLAMGCSGDDGRIHHVAV